MRCIPNGVWIQNQKFCVACVAKLRCACEAFQTEFGRNACTAFGCAYQRFCIPNSVWNALSTPLLLIFFFYFIMFQTFQVILMPISFGLLFTLMLLYWGQAAIFSYTKYSRFTTILFFLSLIALTFLLICRFLDSGHLPLSNLYESLLFLSWSFLVIQFALQINNKTITSLTEQMYSKEIVSKKDNVLVLQAKPGLFSQFVLGNPNLSTSIADTSKETSTSNLDTSKSSITDAPALLENQFTHFLGVITSPMSLLTYSFAFFYLPKEMQKTTSLVPALQSNWLMMHVTVMILSYAALLCGSLFSMAFLFLNFLEKSKVENKKVVERADRQQEDTITESFSLSLSEKLDNYSYRVLALGFPLLTVGILSGAVWANQAWGSYWSWDPKESWALITWLVFAIYLHARITKGWSGEKPAIIATFGFFVVWFCYLGVNLLGAGLHSYGWFSK